MKALTCAGVNSPCKVNCTIEGSQRPRWKSSSRSTPPNRHRALFASETDQNRSVPPVTRVDRTAWSTPALTMRGDDNSNSKWQAIKQRNKQKAPFGRVVRGTSDSGRSRIIVPVVCGRTSILLKVYILFYTYCEIDQDQGMIIGVENSANFDLLHCLQGTVWKGGGLLLVEVQAMRTVCLKTLRLVIVDFRIVRSKQEE